MEKKLIILRGIVQGVGFRFFAYRKAKQFNICGYVRNLPDGSVEILGKGEKTELDGFINIMRNGPFGAHVESCEVSDFPYEVESSDFEIRP
jgi:acylphosphatase